MKEGYPILDEIDQWLFDNLDILPGCCSSILHLKHTIAREVAEKLWPKKLSGDVVEGEVTMRKQGILYVSVPLPKDTPYEFKDKVKTIILKKEQ